MIHIMRKPVYAIYGTTKLQITCASAQSDQHLCYFPGAVARSEASSLGMQVAPSSIPTSSTFFRGDLVMKTFLRPFSLFH